jgi:hypothetical protein
MSEMAQTAQDLIVIGRGVLMYQGTTEEFIQREATFEDMGDALAVSEMDSEFARTASA